VLSGCISRSLQARLQVSVCSGHDLCHPGNIETDTDRQHFDQLTLTDQPAELKTYKIGKLKQKNHSAHKIRKTVTSLQGRSDGLVQAIHGVKDL